MDGALFVIGIVVGVGLFRTPPLVAAGVDSEAAYLALWALGGLATLAGALCYAELASAFPNAGGEYHFLSRAWGRTLGLFFVWARGTVIQTGSIAVVGFVYGDYANQLIDLGRIGPALHAASAIVALSLLNAAGRRPSRDVQRVLTGAEILILIALTAIALSIAPEATAAPPAPPGQPASGAAGIAMIFILLTYGGWNEAAYLSAEIAGRGRAVARAIIGGVVTVTLLYLAVNAAIVYGFGLDRLRASDAFAADLTRLALGDGAAAALSLAVCAAAISTMNATIFTGARLYYALGTDIGAARLGAWDEARQAPRSAVALQAVVALALVAFGAASRGGFQAMVDYTAPVFWFFMVMTALSLFVFRRRHPDIERPFRVPLYPLTPAAFALVSLWLLWSSLSYTGAGALLGLGMLALGIPFVLRAQRQAGGI